MHKRFFDVNRFHYDAGFSPLCAMIVDLFLTLLPIALLIALGAGLRQQNFLADAFWPQAERLCYFILLPALFIHSLATADLRGLPIGNMVAVLLLATLTVALLLLVSRRWMAVSKPAFTSIFQGGIRFNNYVGVSAAAGLLGAQGVALAAVANATLVPTVNVLCVLVFVRLCPTDHFALKHVLLQIIRNPLVAACAIGIGLQASGWGLPPGLDSTLKTLGAASLPLGLLCVGAALDFSAARQWMRPVVMSSLARFVLLPLATVLACRALGLQGPAALVALLFQAMPTASSSYILARQLGGDAPLMAGIIACQTLLAALALPVAVLLLAGWL